MNWYYVDAGQQAGPVTDEQLDELVRAGKVRSDTLIWRDGMANWEPHAQARPGVATTPPPVTAPPLGGPAPLVTQGEVVCAECQQLFPRENTIQYGNTFVCATCKPRFVQRLREGAVLPGGETELVYAGFWIRFLAKFIDSLIIMVIVGIPAFFISFSAVRSGGATPSNPFWMGGAMGWAIQGLTNVLVALLTGFFLGKFGATPGKMALGLRVVAADGSKISYGRGFGRAFSEILTGLTCYLLGVGYLIAAFDNQKRALHDHMAGTRVIKTR